jgi:acyl-CoA hydrolase
MTLSVEADQLDLTRFLKRGDHIVSGHAGGEPTTLIEAVVAQGGGLDLSLFAATSFSGLYDARAGEAVKVSSIGAIGQLRALTAVNRLTVIPLHIAQIGPLIDQGLLPCDVAFIQVSPADAEGNHSLGLISDHVLNAVAKARLVIAEVNDQVPYTLGATIPASKVDVAVQVSRAPVAAPGAKIGATDAAIAKIAAGYIQDGSTLQTGVGAMPDAILQLLSDRQDLGFHSGMMGDCVVDLIEAGVVTNARKPFDAGITITGALIGTQRLYGFADRNPKLGMRDYAYTHGEAVLTKLPKLVTINSAIEVDLTGQVNAEQSGAAYMGGTGGQVDFVRSGVRSEGGWSIIALPATAKGGAISRITAQLSGPVTTARTDVDVIVTEFGSAELRGRSLAERAKRLVAIAHPDYREPLDREAFEIARRGF